MNADEAHQANMARVRAQLDESKDQPEEGPAPEDQYVPDPYWDDEPEPEPDVMVMERRPPHEQQQ